MATIRAKLTYMEVFRHCIEYSPKPSTLASGRNLFDTWQTDISPSPTVGGFLITDDLPYRGLPSVPSTTLG
jgi:hypothetical protein